MKRSRPGCVWRGADVRRYGDDWPCEWDGWASDQLAGVIGLGELYLRRRALSLWFRIATAPLVPVVPSRRSRLTVATVVYQRLVRGRSSRRRLVAVTTGLIALSLL